MIKTILALSLFAASSVYAAETLPAPRPIRSADGQDTWTPLETTLRSYTNKNNSQQWDMLFQHTAKDGTSERIRFAVTGCANDGGEFSRVNADSTPKGVTVEWAYEGNQIFDGIATSICLASARALMKANQ